MNNYLRYRKLCTCFIVLAILCSGVLCTSGNISKASTKLRCPQSVKAIVVNNKTIKLKWKSVKSRKKYEIYASTKRKGKYKKIKQTSKCYIIVRQKPGKSYYYKVRAYMKKRNGKKYSSFSKIVRSKISQDKKTSSEVTPTPSTNQNQQDKKTSSEVTPTPSTNQNQEVSEKQSFQSIFVKVSQISDNEISLISETSANEYMMKKENAPEVQIGSRLKIVNPSFDKENTLSNSIMSFDSLTVLGEGEWMNHAYYVKEYANGIIYLSDSLSGDVVFTLNVTKNEICVSKGGSNLSVNNIMVGDCISLFVNSPVSTGIPGIINDCTKISVL